MELGRGLRKTEISPLFATALLSTLLGFWMGIGEAGWQDAVENAQTLAGIVRYPVLTPYVVSQWKAWSLQYQLLAIVLKVGVGEVDASILVCGVRGALHFLGGALFALAFTRHVTISVAVSLLNYSAITHDGIGAVYNFNELGTANTCGNVGQSVALLIVALFAHRRWGLAGFLLALAPAVHMGWGAYSWLLFLALWVTGRCQLPPPGWKGFAIGFVAGSVSFAAYTWQAANAFVEMLPSEQVRVLVTNFIRAWDFHRQPVALGRASLYFAIVGGIVGLVSIRWRSRRRATSGGFFLARALLLSGALSLVLAAATHLPLEWLPSSFLALMPGRFLNFTALMLTPVALGLLWRIRRRADILLIMLGYLFLVTLGATRPRVYPWGLGSLGLGVAAVFLPPAVYLLTRLRAWPALRGPALVRSLRVLNGAALVFCVAFPMRYSYSWPVSRHTLRGRVDRPYLRRLRQGEGILLILGDEINAPQLKMGRPVLLDLGAMDGIPYIPGAASAFLSPLKEVYGIDLLADQGPHFPGRKVFSWTDRRLFFESRPEPEWAALGRRFGFREVLGPEDSRLKLPTLYRGDGYALYGVPAL